LARGFLRARVEGASAEPTIIRIEQQMARDLANAAGLPLWSPETELPKGDGAIFGPQATQLVTTAVTNVSPGQP
jgi:hypothetical protein